MALGPIKPIDPKIISVTTKEGHSLNLEVRRIADERVTIVVKSLFAEEARKLIGKVAFNAPTSEAVSTTQRELMGKDGAPRYFVVIVEGPKGDLDQSLRELDSAAKSGELTSDVNLPEKLTPPPHKED